MDDGLFAVFERVTKKGLAEKLGISPPAVTQWQRCPSARVLDVERITGVPRYVLRPDLYPIADYATGFLGPHSAAIGGGE